jgi:hypothetical protein
VFERVRYGREERVGDIDAEGGVDEMEVLQSRTHGH